MDLWIDTTRAALVDTLAKVDLVMMNESEARMFTNETNLITAGRLLLSMGPNQVVIKKGENGAVVVTEDYLFCLPAYPLEKVCDPTGAGDAFAGGVMGYIAQEEKLDAKTFRNAVVMGTVIGSFCVEDFGLERFKHLRREDINTRFQEFQSLTRF